MESAFMALSLSLFQSIAVLTKYEYLKFSVFAGMGLKHWVLLHNRIFDNVLFDKIFKLFGSNSSFGSLCLEIMFNVDCWYVPFRI